MLSTVPFYQVQTNKTKLHCLQHQIGAKMIKTRENVINVKSRTGLLWAGRGHLMAGPVPGDWRRAVGRMCEGHMGRSLRDKVT